MTYSFKKQRPKSLLKKDTKFWVAFVGISVSILVGLQITLNIRSSMVMTNITSIRAEKNTLIHKTTELKDEYEMLKDKVAYTSKVNNSNTVLKDSLKNLFEIVPDKITLSKVELTPTRLSLFGTTPSRDIFNLQFSPALKSIFTNSETSFIRGENGNSRFISINQIEQKEEASEEPAETQTPEQSQPQEAKAAAEPAHEKKGH